MEDVIKQLWEKREVAMSTHNHAQRELERCGVCVGTICSWPRDSVGKVLWDFNSSCLMSCVNIVFCSCLLGAKLSVKVAEVTKAGIENYLVAQHV